MKKLYSVTATINFEDEEIETSAELVNLGALEDFVSVMGDGLLRKADAFGHRVHVHAQFRIREGDDTERDGGVASQFAADADLGGRNRIARTFVNDARLYHELVAGADETSHLGFLDRGQERHALELVQGDQEPAGGLRHGLDQQHAGHQRIAGEMSLEDGRFGRDPRLGANGLLRKIKLGDAVDELKVLETHAGASGTLGSDEFVDAGAQVVQLKILFSRRLPVVDLLRPLLERHLDAERLVDRKRDVEEIQAVDAEIVDGMAFGLDRLTGNVAGLGDDIGHGVKSRRHQ